MKTHVLIAESRPGTGRQEPPDPAPGSTGLIALVMASMDEAWRLGRLYQRHAGLTSLTAFVDADQTHRQYRQCLHQVLTEADKSPRRDSLGIAHAALEASWHAGRHDALLSAQACSSRAGPTLVQPIHISLVDSSEHQCPRHRFDQLKQQARQQLETTEIGAGRSTAGSEQ